MSGATVMGAPLSRRIGVGASATLAVVALTVLGGVLRALLIGEGLYGDELSTNWVVTTHGFADLLSTVHSNAEITPPLYFVLSWLTTRLGETPELLRLPSLVAGTATIPLVHAVARRTVGPAAALVAAALTAFSPLLVFYSSEARAYAVMVALVVVSTLALLLAVDRRGVRWWALYAAASCLAMYAHYTCAFVLAAQAVWVLWAHPEARRAALLANVAAAVAFAPWATGLVNDLTSPTTDLFEALQRFDATTVRITVEHWLVGHPFTYPDTGLRALPGWIGLVPFALGLAVALAGLVLRLRERRPGSWPAIDRRVVLVVVLALATPVGELVVSALSTNLFGVRNLAASWPGLALALAALLAAPGPRLRLVATSLVVFAFVVAGASMLRDRFGRPDFPAAADFIERTAAPGDVIVDAAVFGVTPGPESPLDAAMTRPRPTFRIGAPQQRERPFTFQDRTLPPEQVIRRAVAAADGRRLFIVSLGDLLVNANQATPLLPSGYRRIETRSYPGMLDVQVLVYGT